MLFSSHSLLISFVQERESRKRLSLVAEQEGERGREDRDSNDSERILSSLSDGRFLVRYARSVHSYTNADT